MTTPNLLALARAIRTLATTLPDTYYVQPATGSCDYFPTPDNPHGCIVGAAARAERATLAGDLDDPLYERTSAWDAVTTLLFGPPRSVQHSAEDSVLLSWIDAVQGHQDDGYCWSAAVYAADREFPEVAR